MVQATAAMANPLVSAALGLGWAQLPRGAHMAQAAGRACVHAPRLGRVVHKAAGGRWVSSPARVALRVSAPPSARTSTLRHAIGVMFPTGAAVGRGYGFALRPLATCRDTL